MAEVERLELEGNQQEHDIDADAQGFLIRGDGDPIDVGARNFTPQTWNLNFLPSARAEYPGCLYTLIPVLTVFFFLGSFLFLYAEMFMLIFFNKAFEPLNFAPLTLPILLKLPMFGGMTCISSCGEALNYPITGLLLILVWFLTACVVLSWAGWGLIERSFDFDDIEAFKNLESLQTEVTFELAVFERCCFKLSEHEIPPETDCSVTNFEQPCYEDVELFEKFKRDVGEFDSKTCKYFDMNEERTPKVGIDFCNNREPKPFVQRISKHISVTLAFYGWINLLGFAPVVALTPPLLLMFFKLIVEERSINMQRRAVDAATNQTVVQ